MKKVLFFGFLLIALALTSCKFDDGKIWDKLDELEGRLDLITERVGALESAVTELDEIRGLLRETFNDISNSIKELNEKIAGIDAVSSEIEELKDSLKNLDGYVDSNTFSSQISAIENALQEQAEALAALTAEVNENQNASDTNVENLAQKVTAVENTLATLGDISGKISAIESALSNLNGTYATDEEVAEAIQAAIASVNSNTEVIDAKISALEQRLTTAFGEQLTEALKAYAKASALEEHIATYQAFVQATEAQQAQMMAAIEELNMTIAELQNHIESYIASLEAEIQVNAEAINALNAYVVEIQARIESLQYEINTLMARLQAQIDDLLARIQSLSYIPKYSDGKATVENGTVTLDFEVSPKDAVAELAKVWESAVSVKAVYTETRAVSFIEMPIFVFESDAQNGIISIVASAENLSNAFFTGEQKASVALVISDGNNSVISDYIQMAVKNSGNRILYRASKKVSLTSTNVFGATFKSNEWDERTGIGIITFEGDITKVGSSAFQVSSDLTHIALPEGVTEIGESAFYLCPNLQSISLPTTITKIEKSAFKSCTNLSHIKIPENVTVVKEETFYQCESLKTIVLPNSTTAIEKTAFYKCTGLESISMPKTITSIDTQAFYGCSALKSINIPNISTIVASTFNSCSSMTIVTIPDSVTVIEGSAFASCSNLQEVHISKNVKTIGDKAFNYCTKLARIYCEATIPPTGGNLMFAGANNAKTIYVPVAALEQYKAAQYWSDYAKYIVAHNFN
jgi:predicted  nucleic acid-binding Zn-ribbon protein